MSQTLHAISSAALMEMTMAVKGLKNIIRGAGELRLKTGPWKRMLEFRVGES